MNISKVTTSPAAAAAAAEKAKPERVTSATAGVNFNTINIQKRSSVDDNEDINRKKLKTDIIICTPTGSLPAKQRAVVAGAAAAATQVAQATVATVKAANVAPAATVSVTAKPQTTAGEHILLATAALKTQQAPATTNVVQLNAVVGGGGGAKPDDAREHREEKIIVCNFKNSEMSAIKPEDAAESGQKQTFASFTKKDVASTSSASSSSSTASIISIEPSTEHSELGSKVEDYVLLPVATGAELKPSHETAATVILNTNKAVSSGTTIMTQKTVTAPASYNIFNNIATAATGSQTSTTLLNRVNLHSKLKGQQLVVKANSLSEVTQAKVSIGNKTISVPLLKPRTTTQLLKSGQLLTASGTTTTAGGATIVDSKQVQAAQVTTVVSAPSQTQQHRNLSSLLNAKRGQKNPTTIVSFSGLQIKPANTKIVVSKKMPLQFQQQQQQPPQQQQQQVSNATLAPPTGSIVTITTTNPNQTYAMLHDASEQQEHDSAPATVSARLAGPKLSYSENIQKLVLNKSKAAESAGGSNAADAVSEYGSINSFVIKSLDKSSLSCVPNVNLFKQPAVGTLSSTQQQQQQQQTITTSSSAADVSTSTVVSAILSEVAAKSTAATICINNPVSSLCSRPIISIQKNISLVLSKSTMAQQKPKMLTSCANSSAIQMHAVTQEADKEKQTQPQQQPQLRLNISSTPTKLTPSSVQSVSLAAEPAPPKDTKEEHEPQAKLLLKQAAESSSKLEVQAEQVHDDSGSSASLEKRLQYTTPAAVPAVAARVDDSNNALLKQLLQNSNSSHQLNQISITSAHVAANTAPLSARKVINVRAPSMGLVSSLEAQLARPVIPPVPAAASNSNAGSNSAASTNKAAPVAPACNQPAAGEQPKLELKIEPTAVVQTAVIAAPTAAPQQVKQTVQLVSKETSFISTPVLAKLPTEQAETLPPPSYELSSAGGISISITSKPKEVKAKLANSMEQTGSGAAETPSEQVKVKLEQTQQLEPASWQLQEHNVNANANTTVNANAHVMDSVAAVIQQITYKPSEPQKRKLLQPQQPAPPPPPPQQLQQQLEEKSSQLQGMLTDIKTEPGLGHDHVNVSVNVPASGKTSGYMESMQMFSALPPDTPTAAPMPTLELKSGDQRKRRKREYQKPRRANQAATNSVKEPPAGAPSSNTVAPTTLVTLPAAQAPAGGSPMLKKRMRKPCKLEEDHDAFTEKLLTHIRQMQPLQVLEPLLNRNVPIGGGGGGKLKTSAITRALQLHSEDYEQLMGRFGRVRHASLKSLYDSERFSGSTEQQLSGSCDAKNLSSIQNDFYDQEFSTHIQRNPQDRLLRHLSSVREANVETTELVEREAGAPHADSSFALPRCTRYPGLVLLNHNNRCQGRMSPVAQAEDALTMRLPASPWLRNCGEQLRKVQQLESAGGSHNNNNYQQKNQNVILSLHSSATDNIAGVLRDLANLLHLAPALSCRIIEAEKGMKRAPEQMARASSHGHLHKLLNGRRQLCRSCGSAITCFGVRIANQQQLPALELLAALLPRKPPPAAYSYFCNRACYVQYKWHGKQAPGTDLAMPMPTAIMPTAPNSEPQPQPVPQQQQQPQLLKTELEEQPEPEPTPLLPRRCIIKCYSASCFEQLAQPAQLIKPEPGVAPNNTVWEKECSKLALEDTRQCVFCGQRGDGKADGPSRLLNFDVDKWVHLNCALWSNGVYETVAGALMNFQTALQAALSQSCSACQQLGATIKCFKSRCSNLYHLPCAIKHECVFYKNKTMHCNAHAGGNATCATEHELSSFVVHRRVFVDRDENRQVATVMHYAELSNLLRVGNLTFLNVGQLLPHQLEAFHTPHYIYPIGYKVSRYYWCVRRPNRRCRYICSIAEVGCLPEFRILVQHGNGTEPDSEFRDTTPSAVWQQILQPITRLRKQHKWLQLFPQHISGEDLFGLTEPAIVRILESLPGIDTLTDYRFKYGRNPLLEFPLAINPSGAARTEPKQRQLLVWRKPHTQRTAGSSSTQRLANSAAIAGEVACPYSKQFVHSKSSQYKKMKQEWRNNVYLARSKIQGLGLYAARDIEKHTMIIEYIGEVIRTEVSEIREKQYESKNRGIYMFRLDEDRVVDATLSGGLARYINHSCNPNCVTEIVEVDRDVRIIIFAKRKIYRGEELSYDYKFDIEDDAHKIPCACGAPNCRKWMN